MGNEDCRTITNLLTWLLALSGLKSTEQAAGLHRKEGKAEGEGQDLVVGRVEGAQAALGGEEVGSRGHEA